MTFSEQICQEINRKFYFDDFVLTNLFYTKDGIKMEICDGLIEFQDIYIILQIKEKAANNDTDENNIKWLSKKVYKKAVSQIKDTIRILQNESSLVVEDMYGQTVEIDNSKKIIPVIIFKADDISDGNFFVNWIMLSKPYSPDQILIRDLKELNLWNGDNVIQKKPRFY